MSSLPEVLALLEQGNIPIALQKCQGIVQKHPADADAQHLLGLLYAKNGDLYKAIEHFQLAINLDPSQPSYHNNISNAYKLLGDVEKATRHLIAALRIAPNSSESFNNLGSLYYTQGDIKRAQDQFEKAIRLNPASVEAHYNLANCYIKQDMVLQAISHYQTVLKLNPAHSNARLNLAMSYVMVHEYNDALPLLEDAAFNNPQHAELQGHLAEAYLNVGKTEAALEQYQRAIALDENRPAWQHNLGVLYLRQNNRVEAKKHFDLALKLQPDNTTAQYMLAALDENPDVPFAPADYVKLLFDQYAGYYNQHMQHTLQYSVPQLLRQAINKFITQFTMQQYVLDLGCGTGLCGVYFRDLARFAVGVDISPSMLAEARNLGAYDALCCCNILELMPGLNQEYFDLVLAADVFVYIGDLNMLFSMLNSAMKNNGLLAFTIEEASSCNNFLLQATGRFAHSQEYISNLCLSHNFKIETNEVIVPRVQEGQPISGRLYVLRKTNNDSASIH